MIVQTAPKGQPHFVILQIDHAEMSGQLARAFGNNQFAPLDPKGPMEYVVTHHDEGWKELDNNPGQDPNTGLPYNLVQTPIPDLTGTSIGSPKFNEAYHPYAGIISSMHTWGLYNGRYGLSDKIFVNLIPAEYRPDVDKMLAGEVARQERLKAQFKQNPETAEWAEEAHLFHNYKLLQFFDTLALYFNTVHAADWQPSTFENVPQAVGRDTSISITPIKPGVVSLSPYPFNANQLKVSCRGRYMHPQPAGTDMKQVMQNTPIETQTFTIVAG